jgi:hypothetical protein
VASHREELFRDAMRALIQDEAFGVPPGLRRDLRDHLYRTDAEGHTLCFDSPQREQLLRLLFHWAERDNPEVAARLTALGILPRRPNLETAPWGNTMDMEAPREVRTPLGTVQRPTSRPARKPRARTSGQGNLFALAQGESR